MTMKKGVKVVLFVGLLAFAIILAGCAKKECAKAADCDKQGYTSSCVDNKCVRTPIPGACGNGQCETTENECICAADCGTCAGAVPGSTLLQKTCINDDTVCSIAVPQANVKPVSVTNPINSLGNQFKVTVTYNQPFNFKRDPFTVRTTLDTIATGASDVRIIGYELSALKNKQNVILIDSDANKPFSGKGAAVSDDLHLDLVTADLEGSVTDPQLKIDYEYTISSQRKTGQLLSPYRGTTFLWVKPNVDYGCPDCDDGNAGTEDTCGPETQFFCEHTPIAGACGNFQCDGNENKCTCAADCGPCSGSAGQYMDLGCQSQACVAQVRSGIQVTPVSLFDDRNLNIFHLNNRYTYNKPFNTVTERLRAEFTLYEVQAGISKVRIETVRALDGSKELGFVVVNQELNAVGQTVTADVPITFVARPEAQHTVTLSVAYSYEQNAQVKKGTFTKSLEKITFITPGSI